MVDISIIIPIYNQEQYLEECLESAANQDLMDYEVLLIDDGSTDMSKMICEQFVKENKNFHYFYQQNTGLGGARNTGLSHACGRYIAFLDADDAYEKNSLGNAVKYMDENFLDILYVDEIICNQEMKGGCIAPTFPYLKTRIGKKEAMEFCMQPSHICARIYRKELFSEIRFYDMWYEDMACFPQLVCAAEKIGYYKMPLYYYRQHGSAITHNDTDERNLDAMKAWSIVNRLPVSLECEKSAIQKAVLKSIATFIFFKPHYADEYIKWYQSNLEVKPDNYGINEKEELMELTEDYPLMQQVIALGTQSMVDWLRRLSYLYENGGEYNLKELKAEDTSLQDVLLLKKNEGIELCGIRIKAKSPVLWQVNKEIRNQNLISRERMLKASLVEKIVVQAFAEHRYPIRIVG